MSIEPEPPGAIVVAGLNVTFKVLLDVVLPKTFELDTI